MDFVKISLGQRRRTDRPRSVDRAAITGVFMAANVYLGLKTGMTFSSSISAAIISMSVLRAMGSAGILENNIVRTQASAAGTLCNVILVLPGLILIGFWRDFPLWQTMAVCFVGGILGVILFRFAG